MKRMNTDEEQEEQCEGEQRQERKGKGVDGGAKWGVASGEKDQRRTGGEKSKSDEPRRHEGYEEHEAQWEGGRAYGGWFLGWKPKPRLPGVGSGEFL